MDKVNNVKQVHGMSSQPSWGILLGILDRVVPPGSLNPDSISDQKCHFLHPFSAKTAQKPSPLGWHGLYKGVPRGDRDHQIVSQMC